MLRHLSESGDFRGMIWRLIAVFGLVLATAAGRAGPAVADDPPFLAFGVGAFDILDDETAADFRVEYRHDQKLWIFKPWAGIEATSDGAVYGVGGILVDVFLGRRLVITPSFGVGAYADGGGKDLGSVLEFRSQVETAYRFDDRSRLGVASGHISNASIGDDNPGTEILTFYYSIPLGRGSDE